MPRLYKRSAELILTRPEDGTFFQDGTDQLTIRNMRFSFLVEKTLGSKPNTCELTINNLAESSRAALQKKPLRLSLSAGYGEDLGLLFVGDLEWSESVHNSTEWETRMILADGSRANKHARTSRSFKKISKKALIKELASSVGLDLPTNASEAVEFGRQFVSGVTVEGPTLEAMQKIIKTTGRTMSIQDGRLQILSDGEVRPGVHILISQDTGMIGSPLFGSPSKKGEASELTVETLLEPRIVPGSKVKIESDKIQGFFKVLKVSHEGDTHGTAWFTRVEARPV